MVRLAGRVFQNGVPVEDYERAFARDLDVTILRGVGRPSRLSVVDDELLLRAILTGALDEAEFTSCEMVNNS